MKLIKIKLSIYDNPINWDEQKFEDVCENEDCVSYILKDLELTLHCCKERDYKIELDKLKKDYAEHIRLYACDEPSIIYVNPPLDVWLKHSDNWCKREAKNLSIKYNMSYDDAYSDVLYAIAMLFHKNKYICNLSLIEKTVENNIRCEFRKNKKYLSNISLDEEVNDDEEPITIGDMIGEEDNTINHEYNVKLIIDKLKVSFSDREIEQILKNDKTMLDRKLYLRLLKWRELHPLKELKEELCDD